MPTACAIQLGELPELTSAGSCCCLLLLPAALRGAVLRVCSRAGKELHTGSPSSSSSLLLLGLRKRWFWPPAPASRWPCVWCQTYQHMLPHCHRVPLSQSHTITQKACRLTQKRLMTYSLHVTVPGRNHVSAAVQYATHSSLPGGSLCVGAPCRACRRGSCGHGLPTYQCRSST
jgi:hypothetical protein